MARIIAFQIGDLVSYLGETYEVDDVYPYIVYLKKPLGGKRLCAGMGDLVIGGAAFYNNTSKDIFISDSIHRRKRQNAVRIRKQNATA